MTQEHVEYHANVESAKGGAPKVQDRADGKDGKDGKDDKNAKKSEPSDGRQKETGNAVRLKKEGDKK